MFPLRDTIASRRAPLVTWALIAVNCLVFAWQLALPEGSLLRFFHLYGIERDDVDYIMETFPIVKRKDEAAHGSYRTKEKILEIYDAMQRAIESGESYPTVLDPPPADPRVAHELQKQDVAVSGIAASFNQDVVFC